MRYKLLIFGFLLAISLMVIIVVYALNINQQTVLSLNNSGKNFKSIATAATEVSSYAKRAEGHLLLYLVLHRTSDKEKYPQRVASLFDNISILDQKIKNPKARIIYNKIESYTAGTLSTGNALIAYCDTSLKSGGNCKIEGDRAVLLSKLHENFSALRELGVNLTEFEIKLESDLKLKVQENTGHLRLQLLFLITLIFCFTVFLGYILYSLIKTLNQEIANRIKSEAEAVQEGLKLRDALAKVKELSGLLPICATCKRIRDDKGYWNQIENYICDHSKAEFSHGICPECLIKFYPEYCEEEDQ